MIVLVCVRCVWGWVVVRRRVGLVRVLGIRRIVGVSSRRVRVVIRIAGLVVSLIRRTLGSVPFLTLVRLRSVARVRRFGRRRVVVRRILLVIKFRWAGSVILRRLVIRVLGIIVVTLVTLPVVVVASPIVLIVALPFIVLRVLAGIVVVTRLLLIVIAIVILVEALIRGVEARWVLIVRVRWVAPGLVGSIRVRSVGSVGWV